jgi:hypothetical protein
LTFEDRLIDTFVGTGEFDKSYTIPPELLTGRQWARAVIETSATIKLPWDPRELGFAIRSIEWERAD